MAKAKKLREGFTTGTAASAAAAAAVKLLLTGGSSQAVSVALPPFCGDARGNIQRLTVPVSACSRTAAAQAAAQVVKDGGDDPDATHGSVIQAHVALCSAPPPAEDTWRGRRITISAQTMTGIAQALDNGDGSLHRASQCLDIHIYGGTGVGVVTLPGLPVPPGEPAINPEPRRQIAAAVLEQCARHGYSGGVEVTICVPDGEERAARTFNPRLGIRGGISILGTRGTVKPYSHGAWRATIVQGMKVARTTGAQTVYLSTGRRSERLLMQLHPHEPETAFVQVADFAEFSLRQAAQEVFEHIVWGCFFGKLVKLGEGHSYTHAHAAQIDFRTLAQACRHAGLEEELAQQVAAANTARHALDIMEHSAALPRVLKALAVKALKAARNHTGTAPALTVHLFDFDGRHLAQAHD
ncbi:cobalt-precorrin-5B (C(1))-methyltransferase CbiD [Oleidesulfovibrio alaskensis]|uniref:cobalt-precorrin-5B (C(1))-methyltransferase CbiD n=1 Tax=Oleidesulfovibrio alaskensis TaxID=58180 RepID=UPI0003F953F2|nr:cobalt-precorrin-5B (C(1))-methyltransferase CbiD [Oleidesulfovibrio alaskensis]